MIDGRKKISKGIATLLVLLVFVSSFSPIFARKAEAFIFTDWVNFAVNAITSIGINSMWIKEYALDAVAYQVMNLVIERMTASTVNWINGGFKGSPGFITNPDAYFKDLGDKVAGHYIFINPNLNFLCGPISAKIRLALAQNYIQDRRWQCTLTDVAGNMEDFLGDFEKGGWDKFFRLTQEKHNSPIGAYLQAENELNIRIATRQGTIQRELQQSNGFLSFKKCTHWSNPPGYNSEVQGDNNAPDPNACASGQTRDETGECSGDIDITADFGADWGYTDPTSGRTCDATETVTPGSVIENKLNNVLNIGNGKLAVADEINEIISALLTQVTSRIVGGIGAGLRGLSSPDSNGNTFTKQLATDDKKAQIDKYFADSGQGVNDVLNAPAYNPNLCRDNPTLPECTPPPGDPNNTTVTCDPSTDSSCSL